jgi:type IVB pilus formation R64 PilN family outer membrane protein
MVEEAGSAQIAAGAGAPPSAGFGSGGPLAGLPSGIPGLPAGLPSSMPPGLSAMTSGIPGFPDAGRKMEVRYTGKLSGLLDQITARMNLFWRYDSDQSRIVLHRQDTQTFTVLAFPGVVKTGSSIDNKSTTASTPASTGGGSSSGTSAQSKSGQSVSMEADIEAWKDIGESVAKMLSASGKAYANQSTGTVTVTDSPVVLSNVKQYIAQQNLVMGSQVTLNTKIYTIELDTDNQVGIDWNLLYAKAADFGVNYVVPSSIVASGVQAVILNPSSNWNGTSVMVKVLETLGKTSLVTSESAITMNNMPVPVKVANETTYLASTSNGIVGGGVTSNTLTTTLQPGKVVTGLTMTMLPKIIDARQLMLQMSIDQSKLKSIDTISSGGASIQAPVVDTQSSTQRVAMEDGQTLVLTGFNSEEDRVGNAWAILPSSLTNSGKRIITVIMVTPQITQGIRQ